jgi:hypothetical protein
MKFVFNQNAIKIGQKIKQPSIDALKSTPSLVKASLDDAIIEHGKNRIFINHTITTEFNF